MKNIWISSLLLLAFFLSGCHKAEIVGEYYLGDLIYSNPYHGTEVVVFRSSNDKELFFSGQGRYNEIIEVPISVNSNDYYIVETDYCSFKDPANNYRMSIKLETDRIGPPELGIGFSDSIYYKSTWYIAKSRFSLPFSRDNLRAGQSYFDSIVINGTYYDHVFSDSCNLYFHSGDSSDLNNYLTVIYYNTAQGLLKFDFSDGSTWELKEIIP